MSFLDNLSRRAMGVGERRIPQAGYQSPTAGNLVSISNPRQFSSQDWAIPSDTYDGTDGSALISKAYLRNVYVYKCIDHIANSIAGCPFRAGDPISFNYRLDHPLAKLLGPAPTPAKNMWSAARLWRYAIISYLLMGKFAWLIEKDALGRIVALWPLKAQSLRPVFNTNPRNLSYFTAFKYGNVGEPGYRVFRPDEIVYVYKPSMIDPRIPQSPLEAMIGNINVLKMLDQFDLKFLKNGGVPAHLVTTPKFANDEGRETFQSQFAAEFGGSANVGKTMFAEYEIEPGEDGGGVPPVQIQTIGTSQRDSEHNTLRTAEISALTIGLSVPLSVLGDASHRTFSNAEAEEKSYWIGTLVPLMREIQDNVNTELAPLLGDALGFFDTRGIPALRKPPAIPDTVADKWVVAGIVTRDEVRADRGLGPGKDVGLDKIKPEPTPPDDSLSADADPVEKPVAPPARAKAKPKTFHAHADACDECKDLDGTVDPAFVGSDGGAYTTPHPNCECSVRHAGHEDHKPVPSGHLTNNVLENILTKQLQALMAEQREDVRSRLSGRRAKNGVAAFKAFDTAYWTKRATTVLGPVLEEMDRDVDLYVADLIASTAARIESSEDPLDAFDVGVSVASVQDVLMRLHAGDLDIDAALVQLSEV